MLGTNDSQVRSVLARTPAEDRAAPAREWAGQEPREDDRSGQELRREAVELLDALRKALGGTLPVSRIVDQDPAVRDALTSLSERRARAGAQPSATAMAILALKRTMLSAIERHTDDPALRYRAAPLVDELLDTAVAHHLLQTVGAVRLTGAECVTSGIRPSIARTIIQLGIDLSHVVTRGSPADAPATAMQLLGDSARPGAVAG